MMIPMLPQYRSFLLLGYPLSRPLYGRYIINTVFLPFLRSPKSRFRTRFPSTFRTPLQGIKLFPCLSTVLLSTTRDLPIYHHLYKQHLWNHTVRTTNSRKDTFLLSLHQDRAADMVEDLPHSILFF